MTVRRAAACAQGRQSHASRRHPAGSVAARGNHLQGRGVALRSGHVERGQCRQGNARDVAAVFGNRAGQKISVDLCCGGRAADREPGEDWRRRRILQRPRRDLLRRRPSGVDLLRRASASAHRRAGEHGAHRWSRACAGCRPVGVPQRDDPVTGADGERRGRHGGAHRLIQGEHLRAGQSCGGWLG